MEISDFAVDDNFKTAWVANALGPDHPYLKIFLDKEQQFNMIALTEEVDSEIISYRLDARVNGLWHELMTVNADVRSAYANAGSLLSGPVSTKKSGRVTVLRFGATYADAIRLTVLSSRKTSAPDGVYESGSTVAISELGIYNERPR